MIVPKASDQPLQRRVAAAVVTAACALLSGCTYDGFGSLERHYATHALPEPTGTTVHVCHAYGCGRKTRFRFTEQDIADIRALMLSTRGKAADTPDEERRSVAYAIGWIERRVGAAIGTDKDRAGMDFEGSGDPTQQDCVDEATNTTSYLRFLHGQGQLRHHSVGVPFAKENFLRGIAGWTHWTAVLTETAVAPQSMGQNSARRDRGGLVIKATHQTGSAVSVSPAGQRWAVDSWIYANGENPAIVKAEDWYISSLDELPAPTK